MFYWLGQYIITMEMPRGIAVKIMLLRQTIDFPTNVYFALATKAMNTSAWVTISLTVAAAACHTQKFHDRAAYKTLILAHPLRAQQSTKPFCLPRACAAQKLGILRDFRFRLLSRASKLQR